VWGIRYRNYILGCLLSGPPLWLWRGSFQTNDLRYAAAGAVATTTATRPPATNRKDLGAVYF
jgi:hypothetical protein